MRTGILVVIGFFFSLSTTTGNTPPTLGGISNQMAMVGQVLRYTNSAMDSDLPTQPLTFSLMDPPAGALINPTNGLFRWRPAREYGSTTNLIQIVVTDDGAPPLSATQSFVVVVADYLEPQIGSAILPAGTSTNVQINIFASVATTNPVFTLEYPSNRLADLSVSDFGEEIADGVLLPDSPESSVIALTNISSKFLLGDRYVALLQFTAVSNRPSAFVPLTLTGLQAQRLADGSLVTSTAAGRGRAVVVGEEPLMEALLSTNGEVQLIVYALPGTTNDVQSAAQLPPGGAWTSLEQVTMTNLLQSLPPFATTNGLRFYRAVRQ